MTLNQRVKLLSDVPSMNEILAAKGAVYTGGHRRRSAYTTMKKTCTQAVANALREQECVPTEPYSTISISIIWYEKNRRRDPDNIRAGVKFILDGMVLAGVIKNDGFSNIASIQDQFCVAESKTRSVSVAWSVIK
ncbi:MAG: hypothetical protein U9Q37_03085 [Euryarchaeota archaeon]|nr:hypothetical protein [Euryarchaeota archaeon]